MQKIPTLFKRDPEDMSLVTKEVAPGCEWVLQGEGVPTRKWDGTCVLITGDQEMFKRYSFKTKGKNAKASPPEGFVPATDIDPITGKQEGWVQVDLDGDKPEDWMHREAWERMVTFDIDTADVEHGVRNFVEPGTYELIGPKVNGNPEGVEAHVLIRHGIHIVNAPRSWDLLAEWLAQRNIEGVVWHHPDGRMAKIKAIDFGVPGNSTDVHRLKRGTFRRADVEAERQAARKAT